MRGKVGKLLYVGIVIDYLIDYYQCKVGRDMHVCTAACVYVIYVCM